jgi:ubiquitin-protein ligase
VKIGEMDTVALLKQLEGFDNHGGLVVITPIEDKLTHLRITLRVVEGMHAGASYVFEIVLNADNRLPPTFHCKSPIFHPNICDDCICCNTVGEDWDRNSTLDSIVADLYCLLDNPNFDEPLEDDWWRSLKKLRKIEYFDYDPDNYEEDLKSFIKENF